MMVIAKLANPILIAITSALWISIPVAKAVTQNENSFSRFPFWEVKNPVADKTKNYSGEWKMRGLPNRLGCLQNNLVRFLIGGTG